MRTPLLLTALPLVFAVSMPAFAQQLRERAEAPPPPQLERLEEGEAPAVTIPGGGQPERSIPEKREQGRVTEVEVRTGRSTYVVKPLNPAGSALPGDTQANTNRAAQFKVKEFDLSKPEDLKPRPQPQAPQAPAAPPPAK
jgi:ribosomal protein L21E